MGCMREKGAVDLCPACNWREGTPAASILELAPGTVINGVYVLGRVVGEGGFGVTYIGWDLANRRRVAVKEYFPRTVATRTAGSSMVTPLAPQSAEDFEYGLKRFSEESRVLTMFRDHPCIVSCLDFQSANGTAYLVMEFLEGKTLAAYLRERNGRMGCEPAFNVTMRILDGLREVHHHGLLHRDVSPDNIFLTRTNGVKLLDFGAARFAMGERSQNLSVILKPGYAPPEQYLRRGRQGPQTDIYATGATFYRAVTGQVPPEALERKTHDSLEPPSRLGVTVEPHVEKAMMRAMSLEMRDRFKTAQDFQEALRRFKVDTNPERKPAAARVPNIYLAYAVGALLGALVYLPFLFPSRFGWAGTPHPAPTIARPAAPTGSNSPLPSPAASPAIQISYGTFEANLTGGRVSADINFQIRPFEGRHGCAVLVLADGAGAYLLNSSGKTFEVLRDFTSSNDQAPVSVHFDDAAPASATAADPTRKLAAQTILFANPCSVADDPLISKSVAIPVRTP
jgi:serine/threonine protein kinase